MINSLRGTPFTVTGVAVGGTGVVVGDGDAGDAVVVVAVDNALAVASRVAVGGTAVTVVLTVTVTEGLAVGNGGGVAGERPLQANKLPQKQKPKIIHLVNEPNRLKLRAILEHAKAGRLAPTPLQLLAALRDCAPFPKPF
jgi:hypothetical protein